MMGRCCTLNGYSCDITILFLIIPQKLIVYFRFVFSNVSLTLEDPVSILNTLAFLYGTISRITSFSLAAISLSSIGFLLSMDIGVSPLSLITAALVFVLLFRITPVIIAATSTATEITIPNVLFLFSSASTSLKLNFNPVTFLRVQVVNHLSLFGIIHH